MVKELVRELVNVSITMATGLNNSSKLRGWPLASPVINTHFVSLYKQGCYSDCQRQPYCGGQHVVVQHVVCVELQRQCLELVYRVHREREPNVLMDKRELNHRVVVARVTVWNVSCGRWRWNDKPRIVRFTGTRGGESGAIWDERKTLAMTTEESKTLPYMG